ncbi:hypothetical protein E2C01_023166 [Portunus trituberculatus]|uniref:Uncharacterized protein n=1 Tax=Portunus trituberculatus TaxID=210409 RepID=A0A5B7E7A5_PORTR|nr:hypothetical protein [Portunus trituberculatus]
MIIVVRVIRYDKKVCFEGRLVEPHRAAPRTQEGQDRCVGRRWVGQRAWQVAGAAGRGQCRQLHSISIRWWPLPLMHGSIRCCCPSCRPAVLPSCRSTTHALSPHHHPSGLPSLPPTHPFSKGATPLHHCACRGARRREGAPSDDSL